MEQTMSHVRNVLILGFVTVAALNGSSAKTRVSLQGSNVVASVTPGATTAWFTMEQDSDLRGLAVSDRSALLSDSDNDGLVSLDVSKTQLRAFYVVLDLSTGDYDVAMSAGMSPRRRPLQPRFVVGASNGIRAHVNFSGVYNVVWVARPGVGAWSAWMVDGDPNDGDGERNGNVMSFLGSMHPIGSSPQPPLDFQPGDVVAVGDPLNLNVFEVRVTK
jgi:hypothetical protein